MDKKIIITLLTSIVLSTTPIAQTNREELVVHQVFAKTYQFLQNVDDSTSIRFENFVIGQKFPHLQISFMNFLEFCKPILWLMT